MGSWRSRGQASDACRPRGALPSSRAPDVHVETLVDRRRPFRAWRPPPPRRAAATASSSWTNDHVSTTRPPTSPCLTRTTALGIYDDGYVVVLESASELERLWHVRADPWSSRPVPPSVRSRSPGNDRPGIMLAIGGGDVDLEGVRAALRRRSNAVARSRRTNRAARRSADAPGCGCKFGGIDLESPGDEHAHIAVLWARGLPRGGHAAGLGWLDAELGLWRAIGGGSATTTPRLLRP